MPRARSPSLRRLPDGTPLHNRLLGALPRAEYDRISQYVKMTAVTTGHTLHAHRGRIKDVYFPNGGVFSVTNEMRNGPLVEVATVGREGMLGIGVFFGDRTGIGRAFQQVAEWPIAVDGRRQVCQGDRNRRTISRCRQCLRSSESTADHAVHRVQRAAQRDPAMLPMAAPDARPRRRRHLVAQTGISCGDARRAASNRHRVLRALQEEGLISSRYGRIQILQRKRLEGAACECYGVIRANFERLGL